MAVFTLGDAASRALGAMTLASSSSRTWTPARAEKGVLPDSKEAGSFEERFFAVPAKGETDRLLRTARQALDAARRLRRDTRAGVRTLSTAERAIAALTAAAVRVYEEILALARLNHGRVFPTYDHLANATGLGRATVARALPVLERIGFLVRQRRFRRIDGHGAGPRYAQTSNVYRPLLPTQVLAYLPRWTRPAPPPADDLQRRADQTRDHNAMLATLDCRELAHMTLEGPLGRMLAKLGSAIDRQERESQNDPLLHHRYL